MHDCDLQVRLSAVEVIGTCRRHGDMTPLDHALQDSAVVAFSFLPVESQIGPLGRRPGDHVTLFDRSCGCNRSGSGMSLLEPRTPLDKINVCVYNTVT